MKNYTHILIIRKTVQYVVFKSDQLWTERLKELTISVTADDRETLYSMYFPTDINYIVEKY